MNTFVVVFFSFIIAALAVTNPTVEQLQANDAEVLKAAITVENFDSGYYALYLEGSSAFTLQSFYDANIANAEAVYNNLVKLLANERAHVGVLASTLLAANGTSVPACTYNYPATASVNDFIFYSKLFENVGTAVYDGSIGALYSTSLMTAAATIATVEARHASFLNSIPGITTPAGFTFASTELQNDVEGGPFPNAFDITLTPQQAYTLINSFLTCPYSLPVPSVNVIIPVTPPNPTQQALDANDLATLQYALTLELLEATFYNQFTNSFTTADYAEYLNVTTAEADIVRNYIMMVGAHENSHVSTLISVISLFTTPVANCTYSFGTITDVGTFLATAALLEETGVTAYDGAVNTIFDPDTRQTAATIATVEARHAAYLSALSVNASFAYPKAFDTPVSPTDIVNTVTTIKINGAATALVSACPIAPPIPFVPAVVPTSNDTTTTGDASSTSTTNVAGTTSTTAVAGSTSTTNVAATTSTTAVAGSTSTTNVVGSTSTTNKAATGTTTSSASVVAPLAVVFATVVAALL